MEHSYMPVIYICAPYADDPEGNTEKAKNMPGLQRTAGTFRSHLISCSPLWMKQQSAGRPCSWIWFYLASARKSGSSETGSLPAWTLNWNAPESAA